MRKRVLFAFALVIVLFLSSCSGYTSTEVGKMQDEWSEQLNEMEKKYYSSAGKYSDLSDALADQENNLTKLSLYFNGDSSVSYDQASDAFLSFDEFYEDFLHGKY